MLTNLIFGQIHCHKKYNDYSPLTFSVTLQGHLRSSLFGHANNPQIIYQVVKIIFSFRD